MRTSIYIIFALLGLAHKARAQDTFYNFVRASGRIIFEDGPLSDVEGALPASWAEANPANAGVVAMDGDVPVLRYLAGKGLFAKAKISDPYPVAKYITFECDVQLEDSTLGKFAVAFSADGYTNQRYFTLEYNWLGEEWVPYKKENWFKTPLSEIFGSGRFRYNQWHHIAISFTASGSLIYIDEKASYPANSEYCRRGTRANAEHKNGFMPRGFSLGGLPRYMVKNIVFAASETIPQLTPTTRRARNDFSSINTERRFITHAIHFDVNESVIKTESVIFIADLAKWLSEHPDVKLEIGGYTDSDGDAAANMKLSQARADAVKKQLVESGVAATRLTTKGYGATKPLQPNTTEAGKAENRRVEFIKQ